MVKKVLFMLVCLLAYSVACQAATRLLVELKDGEVVTFDFADHPKAVFQGETLLVTSDALEVEYDFADVHQFTFEDEELTGVDKVALSAADVKFAPGTVTIKGTKPGSRVLAYTLQGIQYAAFTADGNGALEFSTADWPQGIYILKADGISVKFVKR
jgi:hypothetical protein